MTCTAELRRGKVRHSGFNGVDSVDVGDGTGQLTVSFLGAAPEGLGPANFRIDGGHQVTGITVKTVTRIAGGDAQLESRLVLTVDKWGDLSVYRLSVVQADPLGGPGTEPYPGFDPRYASAEFTFRPECADLDCAEECCSDQSACPPDASPPPEIDYLAKDYESFRQAMFDRLSLTMPAWTERHVPDLGVALVELLAYEGDRLSYRQDAVATEAYLDTARRRVSVRRHARLVDYAMHDGCTARAWVCVDTDEDLTLPAGDFRFATLAPGALPGLGVAILESDLERQRNLPPYQVFEPVHAEDVALYQTHNTIHLWTWGDSECCLPVGTTSAALIDSAPVTEGPSGTTDTAGPGADLRQRILHLRPGDVLVFEETIGAKTHAAADADRTHRQAVRLISVTRDVDRLYDQPILRVAWGREDALTFPFCVTSKGGAQCEEHEVGVARGNVVLVGHGGAIDWCGQPPQMIDVPVAPAREPGCPPAACFGCPDDAATAGRPGYPPLPIRFSPALGRTPVSHSAPFPSAETVAAAQAKRLLGLPKRARRRLTAIWRGLTAPHNGPLSPADRAYLATLFGEPVLQRLRVDDQPEPALRTLIARFDELLAAKLKRWAELVRRARAGYVLRFDAEGWEIGQSWGEDERVRLRESGPVFRGPASAATVQDPRAALPEARVTDQYGHDWRPRRDLFDSGPADRDFVGETDDDGVLRLRFGDGRNGAAFPLADQPGRQLTARYRVGNGTAGNVGAEAISRIIFCSTHQAGIRLVRNSLPAAGGVDPEPVDDVRQLAPIEITHRLLRAITKDDYAAVAAQTPGVRRAAADLRWTGSWYEAQVAVEAFGTEVAPDHLLDAVRDHLFRYRRIGHDLAVFSATLVPLDIALHVQVDPEYVAAHVEAGIREAFAVLFAPDAMTFGAPIRVSRLVAAAVSVPGVRHAEVTKLARLFGGPGRADEALATGILPIGPLEVGQLDADPAQPEHGVLTIYLEGGR
jgi:predicted phage baseplate assembly protein